MIPKIKRLPKNHFYRTHMGATWLVNGKHGGDLARSFGDAFRLWLWHCGVPPKIAFGYGKKARVCETGE